MIILYTVTDIATNTVFLIMTIKNCQFYRIFLNILKYISLFAN